MTYLQNLLRSEPGQLWSEFRSFLKAFCLFGLPLLILVWLSRGFPF